MAPQPRFQYGPFMNTTFTSHETSHMSNSTAAPSTTKLYGAFTSKPSVETFTSTACLSSSTSRSTTELPLPTTTFMVRELGTTTATSKPAITSTELNTSSTYESTVTSTASIDSSTVISSSSSVSPDVFFSFQNKVVVTSSSSFPWSSTLSPTTTPITNSILSTLTSTSISATPLKIPSSPSLLFMVPAASSSMAKISSPTSLISESSTTATPRLLDYNFTSRSNTLSAAFLESPFPAIPAITSDLAQASRIAANEAAAASFSTSATPPQPQNKTPAIVAAATVPIVAFIFLISIFMLWFKRQAKRRAIREKVDRKLEEANGGRHFEYTEGEGKPGSRSVTFADGRKGKGVNRDSTLAAVDGEVGGPEGEMRGRLSMGG